MKWFLTLLIGFLVVLILTLLLLLQEQIFRSEWMLRQEREARADQIAALLDSTVTNGRASLDEALETVRRTNDVAMLALRLPDGRKKVLGIPGSDPLETHARQTRAGRLEISFETTGMRAQERTFRATATIVFVATLAGVVLAILYVPRIVSPIEDLLDRANELGERPSGTDETRYLVDTFQQSIDTLKQQEEELRRLHALEKSRADELQLTTATLTRSLTSGFLAVNAHGRIVELNQAGREILGIAPSVGVNGKGLAEALGAGPLADALEQARVDRAPIVRREIEQERSGSEITIGLTAVPVRDESNSYLGMLAIFTDLTPVRALERSVREMQNLADLGQISAGIAHEFRNSISAIQGYLKLARKQSAPEQSALQISRAEQEASSLAAAVEGLLSFARPMHLEHYEVDMRPLVSGIIDRLQPLAANVDFEITGDVKVTGDAALLTRAIENVLRNAAESVQQKGERGLISVSIADHPPTVVIDDAGVGFPAGDITLWFLPFQSTKANGYGLGLSLARKIILLHGGSVRLRNRDGGGASVSIELPKNPAGSAQERYKM